MPCERPLWTQCIVRTNLSLHPGEKLNLYNIQDAYEISDFGIEFTLNVPSFPSEVFEQLPSLENVDFSHGLLQNVSIEMFRNANNLKHLRLFKNKIETIPKNAFSLVPKLGILNLGSNLITDIENETFNLPNLRKLDLSGNELTILRTGVFSGAPDLRTIVLRNNSIETIEDGVFDLPYIERIDLEYNHLKTLPPNLLANARRLLSVSFKANELAEIVSVLENMQPVESVFVGINLRKNPNLNTTNLSIWCNIRRSPKNLPYIEHEVCS